MTSLSCKFDTAHRDVIHDARLNFYGNRLATCSSDRTIKIFEVKTNGQSYPLAELAGHSGPVWQVSWAHPQFNGVLASASYDKSVIIWNECDGKWQKWYEWKDHEASVNSVAFGPHQYGLILATASADSNIAILSYNVVSGQWSSKLIIKAHEQGVNSVSWAPIVLTEDDGDSHKFTRRIVSCGNDKFVKIWVELDGEWICEQTLGAHTDFVKDVSWCPVVFHETHTIVSCGQDRSVYIWRCKDIKSKDWIPKLLEKAEGSLWHVNWSLCGTMLSVSGEDNKIAVWKEDLSRQWKRISDGEN